jgi:hypothetical protein
MNKIILVLLSLLKNVRLYIAIFLIALGYQVVYNLYLPKPEDFNFIYYGWNYYLARTSMFFSGIVILMYFLAFKIDVDIKENNRTILFRIGMIMFGIYVVYMLLFLNVSTQALLPSSRFSIYLTLYLAKYPCFMFIPGILVSIEMMSIRRGRKIKCLKPKD